MARLPNPGSDDDTWGIILNTFLSVSHNPNGTLETSALTQAGAVTSLNGQTPTAGNLLISAGTVGALPTSTKLAGLADTSSVASATDGQVLSYDGTSNQWSATSPAIPAQVKAMVPLYMYPTYLGSFWNVIEENPTNVEYVIANVNSGPGSSANSDYTTHIGNMHAVGVKVLGYIDTDYGAISQASVEAQMSSWASFYTVDGFFLDRAQNTTGSEAYYEALNTYAKGMSGEYITVNNYGTTFVQTYMNTADIHVITEVSEPSLLAGTPSLTGYDFVYQYPTTRFAEIIYGATSANLQTDLNAITQRHSGYVFLTPDETYGSEPSFWTQEQSLLGGFGALGQAGGDLSGNYPDPTVAAVNGVVLSGTPTAGQVLTATGSAAAVWHTPATAPAVFGLAMWTIPMYQANLTTSYSTETLVAVMAYAATTVTITKLGLWVVTAGAAPGSGVNGLALYSTTGTKLAQTGDMTSAFETAGYVEGTLTTSYTLTAGTSYYIVYLNNLSTAPVLATDGSPGLFPVVRGYYPSVVAYGQTSFPTSFTPSSMVVGSLPLFFTAGT
jgi:hypothetical protein